MLATEQMFQARKAMRVFFAIRRLSQQMSGEEEKELPLTVAENSAKIGDVVDLSNCDLVSCKMLVGDKTTQHFMVFNETEFLLVDHHKSKLGCGVVHFIAFLQDIDISGDPANTHSLFVIVHSRSSTQKRPTLSGKFIFEDHIRCIAAKSVFQRARDHLHHYKMTRVAKMLHLPLPDSPSAIPVTQTPAGTTHPSAVSVTPTLAVPQLQPPSDTGAAFSPSPAKISSSVLNQVFEAPKPTSVLIKSQDIELSSMTTPEQEDKPSLSLELEVVALNTPVRLLLPATLPNSDPSAGTASELARDDRSEDLIRDLSATPEPSSCLGVETDEEALTASGGLFEYSRASNDALNMLMWEEGKRGVALGEGEGPDGTCPLGMELSMDGGNLEVMPATEQDVSSVANKEHHGTEHAQSKYSKTDLSQESKKCEYVRVDKPLFSPTPSEEHCSPERAHEDDCKLTETEEPIFPHAPGEELQNEHAGSEAGDFMDNVCVYTESTPETASPSTGQHNFLEPTSLGDPIPRTEHVQHLPTPSELVEVSEPSEITLNSEIAADSELTKPGFDEQCGVTGVTVQSTVSGASETERTSSGADCSGTHSSHKPCNVSADSATGFEEEVLAAIGAQQSQQTDNQQLLLNDVEHDR